MIKRPFLILLLIVVFLFPLYAGDREGLFVGLSLGVGATTVSSEDFSGNPGLTRGGPAFSFKLGYAPSNQLQIHIGFIASMFRPDRFKNLWKKEYFAFFPILLPINVARSSHIMFELAGVTYYFEPEAPSFWVGGGIGVNAIAEPFWNETVGGVGFRINGGYEFSKYFSIMLSLFGGQMEDEDYNTVTRQNSLYHSTAISAVLSVEFCLY